MLPQIRAGKLVALAVAASQRSPLLPQVPTFDEGGVPEYRDTAWYGVLAPAGTPAHVLGVLEHAARSFAQAPATVEKLGAPGLESQTVCGSTFATQLQREIQANTQLARQLDIKLD